jgi:hypothetical protein
MRALRTLHHKVMIDLVLHTPSKYVDIEGKELQATKHIEQIESLLWELKTDIGKITVDALLGLERAASGQQEDSRNYVEGLVQVMQEIHKVLQDEFDSLKENFEVAREIGPSFGWSTSTITASSTLYRRRENKSRRMVRNSI